MMKYLYSLVNIFFISLSFYGQNDTISIIKHTDKDIIVNKESKVVYRGISNSLSIEVPNCKSFTASAEGLTMVSKNLYDLKPKAGSEVVITIEMVLKNNRKKTENHIFKIKNVTRLVSSINGKIGLVKMQKKQFLDAIVKVNFEDKNLSYLNNIRSFNLKIPGKSIIEVFGNKINQEVYKKILVSASLGDIITISDIRTKHLDESSNGLIICRIDPILIEIY